MSPDFGIAAQKTSEESQLMRVEMQAQKFKWCANVFRKTGKWRITSKIIDCQEELCGVKRPPE